MSFQESPDADPARRVFVSYIDKSREYYLAQGFGNPYRWAYNADVPFAPLPKPLAECRIGVVTTSSPWEGQEDVDLVDRPPKHAYAMAADPLPERRLVRATHPAHALRHVADGAYLVTIASQDELVDMVEAGIKPEAVSSPE